MNIMPKICVVFKTRKGNQGATGACNKVVSYTNYFVVRFYHIHVFVSFWKKCVVYNLKIRQLTPSSWLQATMCNLSASLDQQ
jgi:hypothetical protein